MPTKLGENLFIGEASGDPNGLVLYISKNGPATHAIILSQDEQITLAQFLVKRITKVDIPMNWEQKCAG